MNRKITVYLKIPLRFNLRKGNHSTTERFRRVYGDVSFEIMAKVFNLGTTNCANYYYIHHFQWMFTIYNKCAEVRVLISN